MGTNIDELIEDISNNKLSNEEKESFRQSIKAVEDLFSAAKKIDASLN